jgi:hypothetical protein
MAVMDEKPDVERTSREVKASESLEEKDVENRMAGYSPRRDEEYNVTMKTWCVVFVSMLDVIVLRTRLTAHRFWQ